jgi:hypothetical protein
MKNSIVFLVLLTFGMFSCAKPDPCEELVCQNGGVCEDGTCNCPEGFAGQFCETALLPKTVNVSSIKVLKVPATKSDGTAWDDDGTAPDIYPVLATLKADNTADKSIWISDFIKLNAPTNQQHNFNLILPKLSITTLDVPLAFFLLEKDDTRSENMGGISFTLKELIADKPEKLVLDCANCKVGFELTVTYEN